jgi:predicted DNA-binding transcriptional regulator
MTSIVVESVRYGRLLAREQDSKLLAYGYCGYVLTVDKSVRYETAMDRRLFRAIEELERQQSKRKAEEQEKPAETEEANY